MQGLQAGTPASGAGDLATWMDGFQMDGVDGWDGTGREGRDGMGWDGMGGSGDGWLAGWLDGWMDGYFAASRGKQSLRSEETMNKT